MKKVYWFEEICGGPETGGGGCGAPLDFREVDKLVWEHEPGKWSDTPFGPAAQFFPYDSVANE